MMEDGTRKKVSPSDVLEKIYQSHCLRYARKQLLEEGMRIAEQRAQRARLAAMRGYLAYHEVPQVEAEEMIQLYKQNLCANQTNAQTLQEKQKILEQREKMLAQREAKASQSLINTEIKLQAYQLGIPPLVAKSLEKFFDSSENIMDDHGNVDVALVREKLSMIIQNMPWILAPNWYAMVQSENDSYDFTNRGY